ncbi:MAG: hypothetical protein RL071_3943, partial [Pseudomonadota bacterium]
HLGLGPAAPRPKLIAAPAPTLAPPADAPFPTLAEQERAYLQAALDRAGGRIYGPGGAAQLAGLAPSTLQSRMERLGMRRGRDSASEPA